MKGNSAITIERLLFIAPFPPPITGMTRVNQHVFREAEKLTRVTALNWAPGARWKGTPRKIFQLIKEIVFVAAMPFFRILGYRRLYTVSNSGLGLIFTLLTVLMARCLAMRIHLHHHVYSYITDFDYIMMKIDSLMRSHGTHVFLCHSMLESFQMQYSTATKGVVVVNPIYTAGDEKPCSTIRDRPDRSPKFGYLSNITLEKGIHIMLETFHEYQKRCPDSKLILAGPCKSKEIELLVQRSVRNNANIEYRGLVTGALKTKFFEDIDFLVFPTIYRNEAQPLVLIEAMSFGVPVVSYARGCIASLVPMEAGLVVPIDATFSEACNDWIEATWRDEHAYRASSKAAIQYCQSFTEIGERTLHAFLDYAIH